MGDISLCLLPSGAFKERILIPKQLRVEGFIVTRWGARWMEGLNQMAEWVMQVSSTCWLLFPEVGNRIQKSDYPINWTRIF